MSAETAKNPALLKLELALQGVNTQLNDGSGWLELQLDSEIWARTRVNPESPLQLLDQTDGAVLRHGGVEFSVQVVAEPRHSRRLNRRGLSLQNIAAIHGAYAVVALGGGCGMTLPGRVCAFCQGRELTESPGEFWPVDEVVETLRVILEEGMAEFIHFQLGYQPAEDAGLSLLFPYIEAVNRHFNTMVAVTMHPPADPRSIERAYAAGVDALSYNLEAADAESMRRHFPGRARFFGRQRYLDAMSHAAKVFPSGAVLSELVIGLSPQAAIQDTVNELTGLGVLPLLSVAPTAASGLGAADLLPLLVRLFESVLNRGLNMSWARDISNAITPLEARHFVSNAPQLPVMLHNFARGRVGGLAMRSLAKLRRRLRVKRVRASFDSSRL